MYKFNNRHARYLLEAKLDALDASDRSYEHKYENMQSRLDGLAVRRGREGEAGHDCARVRDAGRVPGEVRHVRLGLAEGDSAAAGGQRGD